MGYALEKIENYILYTLCPDHKIQKKFTAEEYQQHIEYINAEVHLCRSKMQHDYFSLDKEQSLSHYIHTHQDRLIFLANTLLLYSTNPLCKANKSLFQVLLATLEDFLSYMEKFFVKHFNLYSPLPANYKTLVVQELNDKIAKLKQKAIEFSIDPLLIDVISNPIESYLTLDASRELTYGLLILFKEVLHDCIELFNNNKILYDKDIIEVLHDISFNHLLFLKYLITLICREVNELPSKDDKLMRLDYHIIQTEKIIAHKPQFTFFNKVPTTKESLIAWLKSEKLLLEHSTINQFIAPENLIKRPSPYLVRLNVDQLSYLLRKIAHIELSGPINYTELSDVFSSVFRTPNTENISSESMRTKYASISKKDIKQLKATLIKLIQAMNSDLTRGLKD